MPSAPTLTLINPGSIWIMGLSAAGKSTLSALLAHRLRENGYPCMLLDGDQIRGIFEERLGYDPESRRKQTRRVLGQTQWVSSQGMLPFIASTSAEAFRAVPRDMREAALAQGVTHWHAVRRVVMAQAAPGMFAAVALGLARAIGETLAVLMLAGNSVAVPDSVLDRGQPLTALIATEIGEAGVGSQKYHSLFGAGFMLIVIVICINGLIWAWKGRMIHRA